MDQNTKELMSMSMSTAGMGAMFLPGPGMAAGMVLCTAPILLDIFFPQRERIAIGDHLVSESKLDSALSQLRENVKQDMFDNQMKLKKGDLFSFQERILNTWHATEYVAEMPNRAPSADSMFPANNMTIDEEEDWREDFKTFSMDARANSNIILSAKEYIRANPDRYAETLPFFMFLGGLWSAYCKFCLIWEYNIELQKYRRKYQKTIADWEEAIPKLYEQFDKDYKKWKIIGSKNGEPEPEVGDWISPSDPVLPKKLLMLNEDSRYARYIRQNMTNANGSGFIDHALEVAGGLKKDFISRRTSIKRKINKVQLKTKRKHTVVVGNHKIEVPTNYYWYDANDDKESAHHEVELMANTKLRARQGRYILAHTKKVTARDGLDKISEEAVNYALEIVEEWEDALESVGGITERRQKAKEKREAAEKKKQAAAKKKREARTKARAAKKRLESKLSKMSKKDRAAWEAAQVQKLLKGTRTAARGILKF